MSGIAKSKLAALDSNIFIYNLEENFEFVRFTDSIFKRLIENKLKAVTSIISLAEILSFRKTSALTRQLTEDFINTPNLEVFDVNQDIVIEAARIRREYGFRLPDCIQLATAKYAKTDIFITNDRRLKKYKLLKVILLKEV